MGIDVEPGTCIDDGQFSQLDLQLAISLMTSS
jgi:hypothetical protein